MRYKYRGSYKEPSWDWDESPCDYFFTLDDADKFAQRGVQMGGRFTLFRIEENRGIGDWVGDWIVLREINADPPKSSN